jgi:hypothetical protein
MQVQGKELQVLGKGTGLYCFSRRSWQITSVYLSSIIRMPTRHLIRSTAELGAEEETKTFHNSAHPFPAPTCSALSPPHMTTA